MDVIFGVGVFVGLTVCVGVDEEAIVAVGQEVGVVVGPVIVIVFSEDHVGEPQLLVYLPILNKYSPGPE